MAGESCREGQRRGEEALLEEFVGEVSTVGVLAPADALRAVENETLEQGVGFSLLFGIRDGERNELPRREHRVAVGVDDVALEATHHNPVQLLLVGQDRAGEALVIEQFEKRRERRLIAVVWRRSQEEPVSEVRGERPNQPGPLAFQRMLGRSGGCNVVCLVHDQDVELARVERLRG